MRRNNTQMPSPRGLTWALTLALLLWLLPCCPARAQQTDTHCLLFQGIPLEGPVDSVAAKLKLQGFTEWGTSDDETEHHFRGNIYGLRGKLIVSSDAKTGFVTSAFVTVGPWASRPLFNRNMTYFINKLTSDYGKLTQRNDAYYYIDDYGMVKLSEAPGETGANSIKIFFFATAPYYKDAANMGLRGSVMEVVTDNPVMENPVEQFSRTGQTRQSDLLERSYDAYGYLKEAKMQEPSGQYSLLTYAYDQELRLQRRTLVNASTGIRSVVEYTYNDDDEIATQSQKVFDGEDNCVLSILLTYTYGEDDYDDNGNWTRATVELVYWEQGSGTQTSTLTQTRRISYWEDD